MVRRVFTINWWAGVIAKVSRLWNRDGIKF